MRIAENAMRLCEARCGHQSSPMVPSNDDLALCPHHGDSLKSAAHRQGGLGAIVAMDLRAQLPGSW